MIISSRILSSDESNGNKRLDLAILGGVYMRPV